MAYYEWLSDTKYIGETSGGGFNYDVEMSNASRISLRQSLCSSTYDAQFHAAAGDLENSQVPNQAAITDMQTRHEQAIFEHNLMTGSSLLPSQPYSNPHYPSLGLQLTTSDTMHKPQNGFNTHHQSVLYQGVMLVTPNHTVKEAVPHALAPSKATSRDPRGRPPSLAATHPAHYGPQKSMPMLPPPAPMLPKNHITQQPTPPSTTVCTPATNGTSASPQPPDPPWRIYTDPMHQTSMDPHFWGDNYSILKCDRRTEPGNVISPTYMVGLPFGGMVEMAHHYPSLEATGKLQDLDMLYDH